MDQAQDQLRLLKILANGAGRLHGPCIFILHSEQVGHRRPPTKSYLYARAMQALSLNISHALATAISTALIELPTPHTSAPTSFRGPTPNTFLRRQSAYRIAAQPPDFSHLASIITW